jgi:hypothetical protein
MYTFAKDCDFQCSGRNRLFPYTKTSLRLKMQKEFLQNEKLARFARAIMKMIPYPMTINRSTGMEAWKIVLKERKLIVQPRQLNGWLFEETARMKSFLKSLSRMIHEAWPQLGRDG